MSDIVERLRAGFMLEQLAVTHVPNPILMDAAEEAANEIERLRAENADLNRALESPCPHCGERS